MYPIGDCKTKLNEALQTLSQQQTLTPVEALAKAGLVTDAIVSYKISRLADNKNDGEITFGYACFYYDHGIKTHFFFFLSGLDATKFDPQTLTTVPNVNKQGFWEANMDAVTINGNDTGLRGRTAILDTGTFNRCCTIGDIVDCSINRHHFDSRASV